MICEHPGCQAQVQPPAHLCPEHLHAVDVAEPPGPTGGPASLADQVGFLAANVNYLAEGLEHAIGMDEFDLVEVRNTVKVITAVTHIMAVMERGNDVALGGDQAWIDAARLVREEESP